MPVSIKTDRKVGIITVRWTSQTPVSEARASFEEALANFDGITIDPGMSGSRLYIMADNEALNRHVSEDWWVDLREQVGKTAQEVLGG